MNHKFDDIETSFQQALTEAHDLEALSEIRISFLGKKGSLTQLLRHVGDLPEHERPQFGNQVNVLRERLENELAKRQRDMEIGQEAKAIATESLDIGLPGRKRDSGSFHPLTLVEHEIIQIFRSLGFWVVEGPEVESDFYNFEALNFPPEHPARDMQDTFFLEKELLLRTHTSPVQIRSMERMEPPLRIVVPGRVYRHDLDSTHSPVFHQVEGLCVGPDITFAHLKGVLELFVQQMFGKDVKVRFRPSFFPFTEPSAEIDIEGSQGWMEILGCGMVDPNVFECLGRTWVNQGRKNPYDPDTVTGFAFGMGIERIAMIRYGIPDIRLFYENDIRFLQQFAR